MEIREHYREVLERGCGTTDIPWEKIDEVLMQRKYFLDSHGITRGDMRIEDLALIAAIAGIVQVPPLARQGLEREQQRAREVAAMKVKEAAEATKHSKKPVPA